MADEKKFHQAFILSNNFSIVELKVQIIHPRLPGSFLEVDNLAQKGQTVFVFEGKSKDEGQALSQLKERRLSLELFKGRYVTRLLRFCL